MKTASEIKKELMDAIKQHPLLDTSKIEMDVVCDIAWICGKVDCYRKKYEVKEALKNVTDIRHFYINVIVEIPVYIKASDADIKNAIENALHFVIPGNNISVKVYEGIVLLSGITDNEQQKRGALEAILNVPGILNVWDFIKIKQNAGCSKKRNDVTNSALTEKDSMHANALIVA